MTLFGIKLGAKLIGVIVLVILILLLVTCGPAACNRIRSLTVQTRIDEGQHGALVNSASDALNTQGNVSANSTASEDLTDRNREDIRNAKGADAAVDPAVRDAGFASLCKRASFRNSPTGRLRCASPSGVAPAR